MVTPVRLLHTLATACVCLPCLITNYVILFSFSQILTLLSRKSVQLLMRWLSGGVLRACANSWMFARSC